MITCKQWMLLKKDVPLSFGTDVVPAVLDLSNLGCYKRRIYNNDITIRQIQATIFSKAILWSNCRNYCINISFRNTRQVVCVVTSKWKAKQWVINNTDTKSVHLRFLFAVHLHLDRLALYRYHCLRLIQNPYHLNKQVEQCKNCKINKLQVSLLVAKYNTSRLSLRFPHCKGVLFTEVPQQMRQWATIYQCLPLSGWDKPTLDPLSTKVIHSFNR